MYLYKYHINLTQLKLLSCQHTQVPIMSKAGDCKDLQGFFPPRKRHQQDQQLTFSFSKLKNLLNSFAVVHPAKRTKELFCMFPCSMNGAKWKRIFFLLELCRCHYHIGYPA